MNKDLLAATSVFAEMVNNNIEYKEIINGFILSIYSLEKKYILNSKEIIIQLGNYYDFDIPEAIIVTQLKKLKKVGILEYNSGSYIISPDELEKQQTIKIMLGEKETKQMEIFNQLIKYVVYNNGPIDEKEIEKLNSCFLNFLIDNTFNGSYSELISRFILKNSNVSEFTNELNLIREGITIFRGIKYSSDITIFKNWNNILIIYLDTEHLFSINGLNGELHKKILFDFYDLVREINSKCNSKKIFLKYFDEVEEEVIEFFHAAKEIIANKKTKSISNIAMDEILNGSTSKSDVIRKETVFFENLKNMGILKLDKIEMSDKELLKYNIASSDILKKYSKNNEENKIVSILKTFTYINFLRKGKNQEKLENIKHIILSADGLTRVLSQDIGTKIEETDFSFSTDIYYFTQILWYRLNKGLGFKGKLPTTLNVVAKAQVILSGKLNNAVYDRYEKIKKEVLEGTRTEEEVKQYYLNLRNHTIKPEELAYENVDEKVLFLYEEESIENFKREQSMIKSELDELKNYKIKKETEERAVIEAKKEKDELEKNKKIEEFIKSNNLKKSIYKFLIYLIPIIMIIVIYYKSKESFLNTFNLISTSITFLYFIGFKKLLKAVDSNYDTKLLNFMKQL